PEEAAARASWMSLTTVSPKPQAAGRGQQAAVWTCARLLPAACCQLPAHSSVGRLDRHAHERKTLLVERDAGLVLHADVGSLGHLVFEHDGIAVDGGFGIDAGDDLRLSGARRTAAHVHRIGARHAEPVATRALGQHALEPGRVEVARLVAGR